MKRLLVSILILLTFAGSQVQAQKGAVKERRLTVSEYRNKMMAGWIGQMVGVGWGAPTEFRFQGVIMPADKVPEWKPEMVNQFNQDDIYVEMTFLRSLAEYGFDVSQNQAGIDFANSAYNLYVANAAGRTNLRNGIAPPNSGHPAYNKAADAIDYQIEADFSGLIAPGLPNTAIALGEKFGRLMNYGDGLYGGQFVGGMYAEAFFENDPEKIIKAGLKCIPEGSQYAEAIRDVLKWHAENPDDWETTWQLINEKYHENPDYRRFSISKPEDKFNIDAKINGAYIVMGLLYGESDPDLTTIISMRCGQDSDCNPSNAAGVLFTTIGFKNLPDRFISAIDSETKFSFTEYTFPALIDVCEKLAREAVTRASGYVETNTDGEDVFVIPTLATVPGPLEQSHDPGPVSENTFSKAELAKIKGSKLFRFSLFLLVILAFLVFKENRNIKAASIFLPFAFIVAVSEILGATILSDKSDIDAVAVIKSMAAALAILLLVGQKLKSSRWYILFGFAVVIIAIVGYAGVTGATDGRYVALTGQTLFVYTMHACAWLVAITMTAWLSRKAFSRLRFNGLLLLCFFLMNVISLFLVTFVLFNSGPETGLIFNLPWIFGRAVALTIVHYLITVFYLVLSYKNNTYDQRVREWLKLTE